MVQRRDYRRGVRRRPRRQFGFFNKISLNTTFILINIAMFILVIVMALAVGGDKIIDWFALNPSLFFGGYVWTLLTSMFMHVELWHLFVNMVSLFFIGSFVERLIGRKRYFWFYMSAGIVAGLAFVVFAWVGQFIPNGDAIFGGFNIAAVGASGALFGVGGLLAVLIPRLKVLVMFIIPMPMWLGMAVLMFGVWGLSIANGWPVGNTAHFGGLVVGVVYGFYLRSKYARKVKMLNRMFGER
jgi:uncharacterized protein